MKKSILPMIKKAVSGCWIVILSAFFIIPEVKAQIATYPLMSGSANPTPGTASVAGTSPLVTPGALVSGSQMIAPTYNSTGYRIKTNSIPWVINNTAGYGFDIPLSPVTGNNFYLTGITANITSQSYNTSTTNLFIDIYYQIDGAGAWQHLNGASIATVTSTTTSINFGAVNDGFYSGHSYMFRFYVTASAGSDKNDNFRINTLVFNGTTNAPAAAAPTVVTSTATATGLYTGTATGTYQTGNGYYLTYQSGIVWGTSANPTVPSTSSTSNGSAGVINSNITGLTAGTVYHVRAYITNQFGTFYGADLTFTTLPPTAPIVATNTVNPILSNKAWGGGVIVDSGGLPITEKGLVWGLLANPTTGSYLGKDFEGSGSASFSDWMKQLSPNTTYHVRAYAINALGTSYGGDTIFRTAAPAPVLTAIPGTIDFGQNLNGATPLTISYTLTGAYLTGGPGNITITAPAGFLVSTSQTGFTSSITVPYTGATLSSTPIYVQFPTSAYGSFSGNIIMTGGGTIPVNADTVKLTGSLVQSPDNVTNSGSDFWLGFGYENKMRQKYQSGSEAKLSVYVATGSLPATVTVSAPGISGFAPQTLTIGANSTGTFTGFPAGDPNDALNASGMPDARLFYTGISNRGIHVTSANGTPISVWMYIAANDNSAGASMIFPTSTWNSSYTVQAYGGPSNNGLPNSFFFVIANEDNTVVTFKPTTPIIDSTVNTIFSDNPPDIKYPAGGTYTVTLNKGQVFNAMGSISGSGNAATSAGFDLSGTTVSTTCDKKIAVFGGNGRCMVTTPTTCTAPTSGSDNLVQQMIPSVAWGTLYYAVPTKTMEVNLFRVYDRIAGTVVKVNGVTLNPATQYNNVGHFYFFETNQPSVITADNPISVTQFVIAGNCATTGSASANGMNGKGDPEMIILSAAQQSITKVTMYAPPFANGASGGSYINVVIPQSGISTFSLDNIPPLTGTVDTGQSSYTANTYGASGAVTLANAFHTFAADPTYAWAKFKVTSPANHTLSSSVGFNAIAYGMDAGESYGFNAGTSVKNLSSIKIIENPHGTDTSSTAVRTCKDNPVTLQIALPHLPALVDSIVWGNTGTPDPRVTPAGLHTGPISGGHATYTGTTTVDGITYYIYTSPVQYTFSQLGTYVINATAYGTFASDCPGQDIQKITVIVGRDNVTPSYTSNCGSPNVTFTNGTIPMAGTTITTAIWNFGDGQLDTTLNPTEIHTYATNTTFNATLTTINSIGCFSKDSVQVDFSGGVHALFSVTPQHTVCAGTTITFDPSASNITGNTSGTPVKWTWNFGEGAPVVINGSTSPVQTHTYNNPGTYIDSLIMESSTGCKNVYKDTIYVQATPIAAFGPAALHTCAGTSFSFTDLSTPAATIGGWHWDFGDPASGTNDSSAAQNPTHIFTTPGSYVVSLNVTTSAGCPSLLPVTQHTITVDSLPTASFTTLTNCAAKTVTFTDHSNGHGGTIVNWVWNFGDGSPDSTVHNNNPITHAYPAGGSHPVTLSVTTANGCTSSVVFQQTIGFGATPVASFSLPSGNLCLPNALATFTNTSTISDGTLMTYVWDFGDGIHAAGDTLSVAAAPASITHTFNGVGPYTITLTATSNQGCPNAVSQQLDTVYAQPLAVITQPAHVCFGSSGSFSAANSNFYNGIAADWVWDFGDGTPLVHQQSPSHTFNNTPPGPGLYHVHLYVTSVAGCTSVTKDTTIRIDSLPTANFTTSIDCSHRIATFTDASLGNGNAIQTWSWNFGDPASGPTNNVSSLPSPVHTFTAAGVPYPVTLTVTTANGCSNTIPYSQTINIHSAPFVNFTLPGNTCLPAANGTFINTSSINDGTLMTYVWNFGDGPSASTDSILTPAAPAPIAHTYNNVGPFIVKLTATSAFGCVHDTSITYNGIYAQPIAVIAEPTEICFGNSASFSANSSFALNSSLTNWVWNFGDGSPSIDQLNPTHAFNNTPPGAGTFHVTLTVTSATGCVSATKDTTIKVDSLPIASFTLPATRCANNSFTFIDNSQANAGATGTITEWHWNFGDGSAPVVLTSGGSTSHTYAVAGTYSVSLWIKNSNGCTSAIYLNNAVVVNPLPVPNFTAQANCSLVTGSMVFTAANNTVANVASWNWNFGTTPTSTGSGQFTTNAYILGGTYNVQLVEITTAGCTDSITLPIPVVSTPTAKDSIINEGNLCSSQPVTVINESVVAGFGNVTKVLVYWDWLNNQSIVTQDTLPQLGNSYVHSYPTFGTPDTVKYTITLIAYNVNGCSDTIQKVINLKASPKIGFNNAAFPNTICQEKPALDIVDSLSATPMAYDIFHLGSYSGIHVSGTGIEIGNTYFNPALAQLGANSITFSDTALNGCYTDTSRDIVVLPTPQITFAPSYAVEEGYSIVPLKPTTPMAPNLIYHWSPATFLNDTTLSTPDVLLPSQDMIYTLQVQSLTGCTATQDIAVNLLTDFPVYNTFTPNGLGTNNTWVIPRIALYPNHHVEVFNRYGQLVFESRNYTPWDGTYKGKTLPEGTYYYIIELGGVRKPKTGYVTIIK